MKRRIFFNDRLACAQGLTPLNDLDRSCDDSYCCNKTYLEVAQWNFEVRGKCTVLRSLRTKVKIINEKGGKNHLTQKKKKDYDLQVKTNKKYFFDCL